MRARARARQLGSSGSVNAIVRVRALRVHNWLTYSVAGVHCGGWPPEWRYCVRSFDIQSNQAADIQKPNDD